MVTNSDDASSEVCELLPGPPLPLSDQGAARRRDLQSRKVFVVRDVYKPHVDGWLMAGPRRQFCHDATGSCVDDVSVAAHGPTKVRGKTALAWPNVMDVFVLAGATY